MYSQNIGITYLCKRFLLSKFIIMSVIFWHKRRIFQTLLPLDKQRVIIMMSDERNGSKMYFYEYKSGLFYCTIQCL